LGAGGECIIIKVDRNINSLKYIDIIDSQVWLDISQIRDIYFRMTMHQSIGLGFSPIINNEIQKTHLNV
jgi:hypothetical protein